MSFYYQNAGPRQPQYDRLMDLLVPASGRAGTWHGELLRLISNSYANYHQDSLEESLPGDYHGDGRLLLEYSPVFPPHLRDALARIARLEATELDQERVLHFTIGLVGVLHGFWEGSFDD